MRPNILYLVGSGYFDSLMALDDAYKSDKKIDRRDETRGEGRRPQDCRFGRQPQGVVRIRFGAGFSA